MTVRVFAAICVVASCTLLGFGAERSAYLRVRRSAELISALKLIRDEIGYAVTPIDRAFRAAAGAAGENGELFISCAEAVEAGEAVSAAWRRCVSSAREEGRLTGGQAELLDILTPLWGKADAQAQCSALDGVTLRLEEQYEKLRGEHGRNAAIIRCSGLLAGLTAAVLLF